MSGSTAARMPSKPLKIGIALMLSLSTAAAENPPAPNMDLIEFLGSLDTQGNSGQEVLTAIDAGLLPDLPEETPYEKADK